MKRLLIALLAACFCMPAFASPAQTASVEKLLTLTEAHKENDSAIADTEELIEKTLKPRLQLEKMAPEKKKTISAFLDQYKQTVKEEFSWEKMRPDYVRIYSETFTEEEIRDLITFYESPTGQMLIKRTPQIADKTSLIIKQRILSILDKMNADVNTLLNTSQQDTSAAK